MSKSSKKKYKHHTKLSVLVLCVLIVISMIMPLSAVFM